MASSVPPVMAALATVTLLPTASMMPPVLVTATPLLKVRRPVVASIVEVLITVALLTKKRQAGTRGIHQAVVGEGGGNFAKAVDSVSAGLGESSS